MDNLKLVKQIVKLLDKKKGFNITVLDMREVASFCDYFVICSALNAPHLEALLHQLKKEKFSKYIVSVEGNSDSGWILIDISGIIIHLFLEEKRNHYSLERLWGDAKEIKY